MNVDYPDIAVSSASTRRASVQRYQRDEACNQRRLWQRCVFVDWHGVLCDQPFWHSITENSRHQQQRALTEALERLFSDRAGLVEAWMRGRVSATRVVDSLPEPKDRRCQPDFLHRRLLEDCRTMTPRPELLEILGKLPELTLLVIATDNMDCFSDSVPRVRPLSRVFHVALCSSDLGVLKAESPERFFGQLLSDHDLPPSEAILIDDSDQNCSRFERFGGHAIRFRDVSQTARELAHWAHSP
jgi:FMN phosphatase YigB (HAD superfamily)